MHVTQTSTFATLRSAAEKLKTDGVSLTHAVAAARGETSVAATPLVASIATTIPVGRFVGPPVEHVALPPPPPGPATLSSLHAVNATYSRDYTAACLAPYALLAYLPERRLEEILACRQPPPLRCARDPFTL